MTGEISKGGVLLPVFRCARGTTSLESFHSHLKNFIPGITINDIILLLLLKIIDFFSIQIQEQQQMISTSKHMSLKEL